MANQMVVSQQKYLDKAWSKLTTAHQFVIPGDLVLIDANRVLPEKEVARKMQPLWLGPYVVLDTFHWGTTVAVKIPSHWRLKSNLFNLSQLKLYKKNDIQGRISAPLPYELDPEGEKIYEVEKLEAHRSKGRGRTHQLQFKVQWKGESPSTATWMWLSDLTNCSDLVVEYCGRHGVNLPKSYLDKVLPSLTS